MPTRLDKSLMIRGMASSRSQAENLIKLGMVRVNEKAITRPSQQIHPSDIVSLNTPDRYVSRAALKLKSVSEDLKLDFRGKTVLDVGSSTGGFTDFALQNGAKKVIAVDIGTNQLHESLRGNDRVELHEKTDIRDFSSTQNEGELDVIVIDVSFISQRKILPHIAKLASPETIVVAMVKPQFEAGDQLKHKGVIKNDKIRRNILENYEKWVQNLFKIVKKADSKVPGTKGNVERFYLLKKSVL